MTANILGNILKEMYNTSKTGEQVRNIHIFSIYYSEFIKEKNINKSEILKIAGLPQSYKVEISKAINIADYVEVKKEQSDRIKKIQDKYI